VRVTCDKCQTSYQVAEGNAPLLRTRVNCPVCGGIVVVPPAGGPSPEAKLPTAPGPEVDFGKTLSFDFSQVLQEEGEAERLIGEAQASPGVLHPGVAYALRDRQTGETFPIPSPDFVVGRSGADLALSDSEISRRHCRVKVMGDHLVVIDLDSTNGTHVRGEKVKAARLTPGQSFTVGNTTLEFTATREG